MSSHKNKIDQATLPFATIEELGAALRASEISDVELVRFFSERLEKIGPQYNALACLLSKEPHRMAKDVDDDNKHERFRGPLHGIPCAVKDLLSVAHHPTTWGAKPYADQVFDYNATAVEKLNGARAPVIAKLSMIELAGAGGYTSASASLQGPGLNPWNKTYWSGGSSSGSGAAVAAGLIPFALGSETSGSILTPACYCGITGLRPTYGLVSRYGAMPLSWTLDKIGVLARTAGDCGLVLAEISGADDNDPASAHRRFFYSKQYYRPFSQMRIGFAAIDFNEWPDEPLRPAFQNALNVIKSFGAQMVETKLPDFPYSAVIGTIIDCEGVSVFEQLLRSGNVNRLADQGQIDGLKAAMGYSALDYLKAMRVRRQIQSAFQTLLVESVDLLIAPTRMSLPDRADIPFPENEPKRPDQKGVYAGLVQASNLAGLPALTVPCGFVNGLPIGLQFVGPATSEPLLLAAGRDFQERTGFHKQHPVVE
ncbi:MAG TPA: amidase [Bryobacteraceae bacterium]|nr:amidase [Bryobacteraceae bacterium]